MERKVIWEYGLGGEESDLGVWINWRRKRFGSVGWVARKAIWECGLGGEESDLGVWVRWRGKRFGSVD